GGRPTAWAALLLTATSPFAISYATAARMYSLMTLCGLLGLLALVRALERPSRGRLACVALVTAVLLYTHYWAMYFVAVSAIWLLFRARRATATAERTEAEERHNSRAVFGAIVVGGLTFLPWVPSFLFQTLHTGTPWSNAAGPSDILGILGEYTGGGYFGGGPWGYALGLALFTLVLLGLFGRTIDDRRVLLELRTRRRARPIAWIFMGTLVLAVLCGAIGQAAFVGRYTAVVFPLFILLAGLGASVFADRRVMAGILGLAATVGLIVAVGSNASQRTEAGVIAAAINKGANPGDLVVYCPDQLGPAVTRLLHAPVDQATYPRAKSPQRIDWVDYRQVISAADAVQFGQDMVARAGTGHAIWYVYRSGYPGFGRQCQTLASLFESQRPNGQTLVTNDGSTYYEHAGVVRFPG
ncbi:MAG TPA: glycosyltransferase family 39 protein, partial [Acidimicrobiales bacterium]|nr:glycosyltransferase family 39 protein [Acidimicrobiales bacterium]